MSLHTTIREMKSFLLIWSGQSVSLIGSNLTSFAIGVWVYQQTGSVTQFALISFFSMLPGLIAQPFAGALADRWNRRWILILCDTGAGLCTLIIALLIYTGCFQVWHIYVLNAVNSIFSVSQGPAYVAASTLLVPKQHLGRSGGMMQLSDALGDVAAPALAGFLIAIVHLWGIILIDFATFFFAVTTLMLVRIPDVPKETVGETVRRSLWRDSVYGWSHITARPGLLGLLIMGAVNNFLFGLYIALNTPLVLSFASTATLGTILSCGGGGALIGGFVMSIWGGPQRRIYGVLGFSLVMSLAIMLAGLRPSAILIACGLFLVSLSLPIISGSAQAIWQTKVALDLQGRVFAIRRLISWSTAPLSFLLAGPLADYVFNPLLTEDGPLAGSFGRLIGVGAGRGIGLLNLMVGWCMALVVLAAFFYSRVRHVEDELSDVISEKAIVTG